MSNYIYARKAVESQVDIEVQVQECRKYAEQHGLEVNEIFIDNGFSGVDNNRPSFTKL
jgi:DNA invertase Pin-like site-specific DNA recombinase